MWILATEEHYIALPPQELCLFPHTQKERVMQHATFVL